MPNEPLGSNKKYKRSIMPMISELGIQKSKHNLLMEQIIRPAQVLHTKSLDLLV